MPNKTNEATIVLDPEEVNPLIEFYLLVHARPVGLEELYKYLRSMPGLTPATLLAHLRGESRNKFAPNRPGQWSLAAGLAQVAA